MGLLWVRMRLSCEAGIASPLPAPPVDSSHGGCHRNPLYTTILACIDILIVARVLEVERKLVKFVPKDYLLDAHHWLILHGRYVCKARKPQCGSCRIEDLCEFKHKTSDD